MEKSRLTASAKCGDIDGRLQISSVTFVAEFSYRADSGAPFSDSIERFDDRSPTASLAVRRTPFPLSVFNKFVTFSRQKSSFPLSALCVA
jgi:hypothetical protein